MHTTDLGEAFKMIMVERGWTQTGLGRELGKDQTWISRVIGGHRDMRTRDAAKLLAKVGWEIRIVPKSDGEKAEEGPVKRRDFVAGSISTLFIQSPKTTPFHNPAFVEQLTRKTIQTHVQMGANSLANTLLGHAQKISSASINSGRELQSAASEFMRWGSYVLRDSGRPDIAVKFAKSAIRYASRAVDPDQQAMAYYALIVAANFNGLKGSMSTGDKDGSQAVELGLKALKIDGISDESRAYLNICLACGLANIPGHERQARAAIERALSIDTVSNRCRAEILGHAGHAYRDMAKHRKALAMLEDAVRINAQHSQRRPAEYVNDQIMLALNMRETELAASRMNDLSYIVPLVDSPMVDRRVDEMLKAAKPWETVAKVRDARERLQSVRVISEDL